jgi:methyltransferase (TIGR00027 family)
MLTGIDPARNPGQGGLSRIAEGITLQRLAESMLPEDVRIFNDPYAVRFIDPVKLAWAKDHPVEKQAMVEAIEKAMPGWSNSIRARVRYFDDVMQNAAGKGFSQIVILGAGYDTRAYRIPTLQGRVRVFEIDRLATLGKKIEILKTIFGTIPKHVTFIPLELAQEGCCDALQKAGFSPSKKTLFVLEGLVMYLSRLSVENLMMEIAQGSDVGSAMLFDFIPPSLADGTSDDEGGIAIRTYSLQIGEPLLSGFSESEIVRFLARIGYGEVQIITSSDYAKMYYSGKNAGRKVSGLLSIAYAKIPGGDSA